MSSIIDAGPSERERFDISDIERACNDLESAYGGAALRPWARRRQQGWISAKLQVPVDNLDLEVVLLNPMNRFLQNFVDMACLG
jgi:hypothetical protein